MADGIDSAAEGQGGRRLQGHRDEDAGKAGRNADEGAESAAGVVCQGQFGAREKEADTEYAGTQRRIEWACDQSARLMLGRRSFQHTVQKRWVEGKRAMEI